MINLELLNENEPIELELKKNASGISDVTINGTSIVSDGVANIPKATKDVAGVVKVETNTNRPVYIDSDGLLQIARVAGSDLDNRNQQKLISGAMYDHAVRKAMCDGVGQAWTDEEKQSAKQRLGIGTIGDGETYEGLVKLYEGDTNNGLLHWVLSGPRKGCLTVNVATEQSIDKRWNNPIGGNIIDYAVKQAMTDGNGAEWTDEEKASARERMGLEWTLLGDVTVEEDGVTKIEIPIDNPNYNEYQFYVYVADRKTATAQNMTIGFNGVTSTSYCLTYAGVGTNTNYFLRAHTWRNCNNGWLTLAMGSKDGKPCSQSHIRGVDYLSNANNDSEKPTKISVSLSTGLDIGSRFIVYVR